MKKAAFLLCVLITICACHLPATAAGYALEVDVGAKAVYLYNLDTESLIAEKNSEERVYPASVTKIMTCILAMEHTDDLDETIVEYPIEIQNYLYDYQWVQGNGAVSLGDLQAGEELTMRQLLYAIMLPSANEAAMAIANHIAGSQADFAEMMNQKAKEIGCTGTNFVNANGLFDENHYTTAKDMFLIAKYAWELPGFEDIVSTVSYESGPTSYRDNISWSTTIQMQIQGNPYYYAGLKGIKTGTLPDSGYCFISTCTRDGFTYMLVVLGSPYYDEEGKVITSNSAFLDTEAIYDWVFDNFKRKALVEKGKYETEIPLRLSSEQDHLRLMTADRFTALVPVKTEASSVTKIFDVPETIDAPVRKGDKVGEMRLILAGEEIGTVDLLAAETVEASSMLILWERVKVIFGSFWFKFGIVLFVLLVVLYIVLAILRNRGRKNSGYRPRRRI